MDALKRVGQQIKLAFSSGGLAYVVHRIPSIIFWTMVSTGLLIGVQFVFYTLTPSQFFFSYDSPATIRPSELGQRPILDYCRQSKGDYTIQVTAKLQKVDPPIYVQDYQISSTLPKGRGCLSREVAAKPTVPGTYKIYYTVNATLPYGIHKYTTFESKQFEVKNPSHIYGDYDLTISDNDGGNDGMAHYAPGSNLEYKLRVNQLIEAFGTTERHLVCGGKDYFVDSYSGRTQAGERESVNRTVTIPDGVSGVCHLELRTSTTIDGSKQTVAETLRSNDFAVQ